MRRVRPRLILLIAIAVLSLTSLGRAQESFRWIDFHNDKDQDIIVWVTRALAGEKWTSIREIGVFYDAALVLTTERANPQATPASDTFQVWSVSLTSHARTPLLSGVNPRWLDWMQFSPGSPRELGLLFDDCSACNSTTYFTAFHYDLRQHIFAPRWMRGAQAVPVWSSVEPDGVAVTQVDALLTEVNGRQLIGTWTHFDYGKQKPNEDFIYRYDLDPFGGLERTELLSGKDADAMKQRLCTAQSLPGSTAAGLTRGQDSALCLGTVRTRAERKPTTTPPANNQGRSVPPRAR